MIMAWPIVFWVIVAALCIVGAAMFYAKLYLENLKL